MQLLLLNLSRGASPRDLRCDTAQTAWEGLRLSVSRMLAWESAALARRWALQPRDEEHSDEVGVTAHRNTAADDGEPLPLAQAVEGTQPQQQQQPQHARDRPLSDLEAPVEEGLALPTWVGHQAMSPREP